MLLLLLVVVLLPPVLSPGRGGWEAVVLQRVPVERGQVGAQPSRRGHATVPRGLGGNFPQLFDRAGRRLITLWCIPSFMMFGRAFLTCSTGCLADTADAVQPNW